VGQISYRYQTPRGLSTKILNVFDVELPLDFYPYNGDGEVEEYQLMDLEDVLESIQTDLDQCEYMAVVVVVVVVGISSSDRSVGSKGI